MSGFRGRLTYVKVEFDGDLIRTTNIGELKPKEVANPDLCVGALIRLDMDYLLVVNDDIWKLKFLESADIRGHRVHSGNLKLPADEAAIIVELLKVEEK